MKLAFKPERLQLIRRLKGLPTVQIERKMMMIGGHINKMNIDRWEGSIVSPRSFDKVELLAKAIGVPVGFFYYEKIDISIDMDILEATIVVIETGQFAKFKLII